MVRESFIKKCEEISKASKVPLPTKFFRYAPHKCWKCKKEILVFTFTEGETQEKMPWTLQNRFSKMAGGTYLANTCPYCKMIQGDFFLYMEPSGPFFGFEITDDFQADIETLAAIVAGETSYGHYRDYLVT